MPMCGFDKQMLEGLEAFYKGLAEAVIRKAGEKNISVEEAISLELKDMDDFLKELILLGSEVDKLKLIGITNYAKSFYLGSLKLAKNRGVSLEEAMKIENKQTREFLFKVDEYFYKFLENKQDSMKQLVHWIGGQDATKRI